MRELFCNGREATRLTSLCHWHTILMMQTVVETPMYLRAAEAIYSEAEQEEIVRIIAFSPKAGDLMPGTGGYRKLRFARTGMGKRGGARVVYLDGGEDLPIFLITVYAKS